ncbi:MAG: oligoendopeptidase F [Cetobacterium sp.]|uniref:oligoendopeptidase F n=1 Tax=Cetobacterium TaxID=180162 RepID=UPI001F056721|nr:oligoendopeptidase F [Cetobacterium somerae]MCX3066351.1 oligoendopeptidase F [Cetobacterium somerae]UPO98098.1 oligoendopeptidase F [Cetobacterium somerae]
MLKNRDEIAQQYKWDLNDIYPNWNQWEVDLVKLKELMAEIPKYQGEISKNPKTFVEFINLEEKISRLLDKIYLYPYLQRDLDSTNEVASVKLQEIESIYANYSISSSWITPEILTIPKETMVMWINENPTLEPNRFPLMEIYRLQEHVLSADKEKLLSYFGQYLGVPSDIYSELSTSDIKWNDVELSDGSKTTVTNGVYSKVISTNRNQEDRKKVFEALYNSFNINKNTYASIYKSILQRDFATAQSRNYKSSLEKALNPKNIPLDVYTSLIESTKENTAPLKRYIALRKKALNLSDYHYYDNSVNIVDYNKEFTYEEAKNTVLESVKPLGEDYYNGLNTALSEGWLDVYETPNKRSGAYSLNIYDVHPYMLLNYNGTMDAVFTLAHELGHTMHSMLSTKNQPYPISSYTIFVAEVASTFNERLLLDNMLRNTTDPKEKIALIEQAIGGIVGTYYIQSLFADYEYQAHQIVENGGAITPEVLNNIMENLFKDYFGTELTMDELQKIIWARIPHFYNSPYYVYQYATSFASSANLYDRITNTKYTPQEREKAKNEYLTLLKSGGNDHPMNQLKKAGVDLSKKDAFNAVATEFNRLLDLLEEELKKEKGDI